MFFGIFIDQRIMKNKMFPQKLFPALIIINQHIKNDFWRSRDTKDWSDDVKNAALHHSNKFHSNQIEKLF